MTLTLILPTLIFVFSLGVLLIGIVTAPKGYENERGFHAGDEDVARVPFVRLAGRQLKMAPVGAKESVRRMTA